MVEAQLHGDIEEMRCRSDLTERNEPLHQIDMYVDVVTRESKDKDSSPCAVSAL